jgi:hypothetical protein
MKPSFFLKSQGTVASSCDVLSSSLRAASPETQNRSYRAANKTEILTLTFAWLPCHLMVRPVVVPATEEEEERQNQTRIVQPLSFLSLSASYLKVTQWVMSPEAVD